MSFSYRPFFVTLLVLLLGVIVYSWLNASMDFMGGGRLFVVMALASSLTMSAYRRAAATSKPLARASDDVSHFL